MNAVFMTADPTREPPIAQKTKMKKKPLNPLLPPPYNRMSAEELDRDVAKFDKEALDLPGRPLSAAQKAQHRRAKRKMGRPIVGKGSRRLMITMERGLLSEADALARQKKLSRSQLIAQSVRALLKAG